jgi:hypothetical protein
MALTTTSNKLIDHYEMKLVVRHERSAKFSIHEELINFLCMPSCKVKFISSSCMDNIRLLIYKSQLGSPHNEL